VHIYPGNYEDYLFRKSGGTTVSNDEAAARLRTDTSTGARIDAATGMLKPVKQVGKPEPAATDGLSRPEASRSDAEAERSVIASSASETLIISSDDEPWESTHEIAGSLTPVTPTPKSAAKRLNPIKLKQMEDRVAAVEQELSDLEARIAQAEQQQAVFTTAEAARALATELDTLRQQQSARLSEWEELASQLEEQTTA
jgi:ATP-binding cassette subfamily F protein 3